MKVLNAILAVAYALSTYFATRPRFHRPTILGANARPPETRGRRFIARRTLLRPPDFLCARFTTAPPTRHLVGRWPIIRGPPASQLEPIRALGASWSPRS